jgi:alpha-L-arabinofuranosidase
MRAIALALGFVPLLTGSTTPSEAAPSPPGVLQVASTRVLWKVPATMYGVSLEEISHALDGGLSTQLVRNGTFKEPYQTGSGAGRGPVPYWALTVSGGARASFGVDGSERLNSALERSLRIHVEAIPVGGQVSVANRGYYGVAVKPDTTYTGRLWAKAKRPWTGTVMVGLEQANGRVLAAATLTSVGTGWKSYSYRLRTPSWVNPSTQNRIVVSLQGGSSKTSAGDNLWLSLVTLFPPGARERPPDLRPDLMDMIAALHPGFMRIPGGNYLEGYSLSTGFPWKDTVGPRQLRPGHFNSAWAYWSSDTIGLLEYLEIAQDLGAEPILALYDGYSVGGQVVRRSQYATDVRDALEEIQYVTGSRRTKWGAKRAADGHPQPFPLRYVEIGNEDNFDRSHSYRWRFAAMDRAIKARYPSLEVVASAGRAARGYFGHAGDIPTGVPPEIIDDHYYGSGAAFRSSADRYSTASRSGPKFLVGEFGVEERRPTNDLRAAVSEAAFLSGLERNSDVVLGAAYAPLLVNLGQPSRPSSLIGFNGLTSFGSPSYWLLRMLAANLGDRLVPSSLSGATGIDQVVTGTSRGAGTTFYIQLVNTRPTRQTVTTSFTAPGFTPTAAKLTQLTGQPTSHNSLEHPRTVVPVIRTISVSGGVPAITLPGYSVSVLRLTGTRLR